MAFQAIVVNGLAGLSSATTRDSCGTACVKSSRRFPSNSAAMRGQPCHVAAWLREARYEAGCHRVPSDRGDDGDGLGRVLGREGAGGAGREDDVRLETDKLLREDRMPFLLPLRPLVPDDEILPLHVAELTETLTKGVDQVASRAGDALPRYPIVTVPPACCAVAASGAVSRLRAQRTRRIRQFWHAWKSPHVLPAGLLAHVLCCRLQSGTACLRKPHVRSALFGRGCVGYLTALAPAAPAVAT